jgi:N-acyl-phosphatidylethanolamine-hydrolysing phospholipase D
MPPHHRPGGGFRNPWPGGKQSGLGGFLKWMLWDRLTRSRPPVTTTSLPAPIASSFASPRAAADAVTITWVGHATFLLQVGGLNILTDPMWSDRASPVSWAGPRRLTPPGVAFESLPPIDVVLQSHDHYDHLDDVTVRRLAARFPEALWITPLGVGAFVRERAVANARELDWWDATHAGPLTITATPAQHFSGRAPTNRDRTLWCGWALRGERRSVWFVGDTGYHPEFRMVGERLGPFDAVLMPVGAYEPRWFMRPVHMNPEDAVSAFQDLRGAATGVVRPTVAVAMHWGTFKLTDEPLDEPPARTRRVWSAAGLPPDDLWILAPGETRALERSVPD